MKKNVIVSLADSNYFPLLEELIASIKRFKGSDNVAICILDAGLTNEQKEKLNKTVDEIKSAEWDIEVPKYKIKGNGKTVETPPVKDPMNTDFNKSPNANIA